MATAAPSADLRLSILPQDLDDLEALFRQCQDIAGALRMVAMLLEVPGVVSGTRDLDTVQGHVDAASRFMPDFLKVVAQCMDSRAETGVRTSGLVRGHAAPRFRIRAGADLGEAAAFLRFQDPHLDQEALRKAHAQGDLPGCFELDPSSPWA